MDDDLTPEQKFAAEDPETMVPRALMQGRSPDAILAELRQLDWPEDSARALVTRVENDLRLFRESPESRRALINEARRQFFGGLLIALLATLGTTATFIGALGGVFSLIVIFFGLFFAGLFVAARGWSRWRFYRSAMSELHHSA